MSIWDVQTSMGLIDLDGLHEPVAAGESDAQ